MSWIIEACVILVLAFAVAPLLIFGTGLAVFNLIEKYGIPNPEIGKANVI